MSRRRLLALLGGGSLLGASIAAPEAFSTFSASRPSDVDVAGDPNGLLGLSVVPTVDAGETNSLLTVTNNASSDLTVSLSLVDPSKGSISPSSAALATGGNQAFSVTVDEDAPGGPNALSFVVDATDGDSLNVNLTRSVGVRNFLRNLDDRTANNNALFYLSYRTVNVDDFDYFEVTVRNLSVGWIPDRTYSSSVFEDVIRIPDSGTDGGAAGHTYEFVMRVYDTSGLALSRTITDVADGSDPPDNDQIGGGPDDPRVVDFTIVDTTQNNNGDFTVNYEVENTANLKEVRVTFDNLSNAWADQTVTSTDEPTGSVSYQEGGVQGDTYDVTVETVDVNDVVTDSLTKTDVADGDDIGNTPTPTPSPGADVVDFTITDTTKNNNGKFKVDYEITSDPGHDYVEVVFDNLSNAWADQTKTSNQSPTGSVNYTQGGVQGDTYEITVRAINTDGNASDWMTKTDVADGTDP